MKQSNFNRRKFIKYTTAAATGMGLSSVFPNKVLASPVPPADESTIVAGKGLMREGTEPRIKFSVIGINHNHINAMVEAVIRGGGQLVSLYAKEADLIADFTKKVSAGKVSRQRK